MTSLPMTDCSKFFGKARSSIIQSRVDGTVSAEVKDERSRLSTGNLSNGL